VVIAPTLMTDEVVDGLVEQMRQPQQRRADLRAQIAANRVGARRLAGLAGRTGTERLREATGPRRRGTRRPGGRGGRAGAHP